MFSSVSLGTYIIFVYAPTSCIDAFENGIDPANRLRIDHPIGIRLVIPGKPTCKDFGELTSKLSIIMAKHAINAADVSQVLTGNDSTLVAKNKVQLLMDTSRYMAALCKILSSFVIPLNQSPPRYLIFRTNPITR